VKIPKNTGAGADYQVPVTVYYGAGADAESVVYLNGKCNTDFSDIRFTDETGVTLQDMWLQSKTDGNNAVYWVEVRANLTAQPAELYCYYKNGGALSVSNQANTFVDVISGVVGAWNMHEGAGGTITDYSGNGNTGTITGASWAATGKFGNCLLFNAGGQFVTLTSTITLAGQLTTLSWINRTAAGSNDFIVGSGDGTKWGCRNVDTLSQGRFKIGGNLGNGVDVPVAALHMLTVTKDGSDKIDSYLDDSAATRMFGDVAQTGDFTISEIGGDAAGNVWAGLLSDLIILNVALTSAQKTTIYTNYPDVGLEAGKVLVRKYASVTQPTFQGWGIEETEPPPSPKASSRERARREKQRKRNEARRGFLEILVGYFELKQKNRVAW